MTGQEATAEEEGGVSAASSPAPSQDGSAPAHSSDTSQASAEDAATADEGVESAVHEDSEDTMLKSVRAGAGTGHVEGQYLMKFLVTQASISAWGGKNVVEAAMTEAEPESTVSVSDQVVDVYTCKSCHVLTVIAPTEDIMQALAKWVVDNLLGGPSIAAPETDSGRANLMLSVLVPRGAVGALKGPGGSIINRITSESGINRLSVHEPLGAVLGPCTTQEASMIGSEQALDYVLAEIIQQVHAVSREPWFFDWAESSPHTNYVASNSSRTPRKGKVYFEGAEAQCTMRFLLSRAFAGSVVGKSGKTIIGMEKSCDARLIFTDPIEFAGSGFTRMLTASADSTEAIDKVSQQLVRLLEDMLASSDRGMGHRAGENGVLRLHVVVPKASVAAIIGPDGSAIRRLIDVSGATSISFQEPNAEAPRNPESMRELAILGSGLAVEQVLQEVNHRVHSFGSETWFPAWTSAHQMPPKSVTRNGYHSAFGEQREAAQLPSRSEMPRCLMKFLMPEALVPAIAGPGGAQLAAMRKACQAEVHMTENSEFYPHSKCRVMTVSAEQRDTLEKVSEYIVEKLEEVVAETPSEAVGKDADQLRLSVLIPRHAAGAIIGAGGKTIQRLEENNQVRIKVREAVAVAGCSVTTQEVFLVGKRAGLQQVLLEVSRLLEHYNKEPWFVSWAAAALAERRSSADESSMITAQKDLVNRTMDGLPSYVWEDTRGFSMSFIVPTQLVAFMLGRGGCRVKEVMRITGTRVHLQEIPDSDSNSMSIDGPLANVMSAYMLMMRGYLDAETHVSPVA